MYDRVLRGYEEAWGPELYADGWTREAVRLLEHVVAIREKTLAEDHPSRLASEKNLARAYQVSNQIGDIFNNSASETSSFSWSSSEGLTDPSSLSYGPVATRHQATESCPTMTFFSYKAEADYTAGKKDDDVQSITSIPDDIESLAGPKHEMAKIRQVAVSYFVRTLIENLELLYLFEEAARRMGEARFVRNHRRLLKIYFLELQGEGKTPSQLSAIQVLRPRTNRTQISQRICRLVMPSDSTVREQVTRSFKQEKDELTMLDRFLSERNTAEQPVMPDTTHYNSPADDTGEYDSDDDTDEQGDTLPKEEAMLSALEATKEFFITGRPFRVYQDSMREFLKPSGVETELHDSFRSIPPEHDLKSLEPIFVDENSMECRKSKSILVSSWWLWLRTNCYPPPGDYHRISYVCVGFIISLLY